MSYANPIQIKVVLPLTCQELTRELLENYAKIDKLTKALKGRGIIHPGSGVQPAPEPATVPVPKTSPTMKPAAPPSPQEQEAPGDQPAKKAGWKRIQGD